MIIKNPANVRKVNFDTDFKIRISSVLLKQFKEYYGDKWAGKVRELMQESLNKDKRIYAEEIKRRSKYLKNHAE